MRLPAAALLLALLAPGLAGCLGAAPPPEDPPRSDPPPQQGGSGGSGSGTSPPPATNRTPPPRPPLPRRISFGGPSSEVGVAVDPSRPARILVAAEDYSIFWAPGCPEHNVWAGVYVSADGGRLWRHTLLPGFIGDTRPSVLTGFRCAVDPVVAYGGDGLAYYAGAAFGNNTDPTAIAPPVPLPPTPVPVPPVPDPNVTVPAEVFGPSLVFLAVSEDGGITWNRTAAVARDDAGGVLHHQPALAVDDARGVLHVAWTIATAAAGVDGAPTARLVATSRSVDGGATWSTPLPALTAAASADASAPALAVGPGGEVVLLFVAVDAATGAAALHATVSVDQGQSFPPAQPVAAVTPPPSPPANSLFPVPLVPALAADPAGGFLAAWNDGASGGSDVLAIRSEDGVAWSGPVAVHGDAPNDQFLPALAFGPAGEALLLAYDRSADPGNKLLRVALARSPDGGATWTHALLNQGPFDGDRSLDRKALPSLGERLGLATGGNVTWAGWTATPTGRGDVYMLKVAG